MESRKRHQTPLINIIKNHFASDSSAESDASCDRGGRRTAKFYPPSNVVDSDDEDEVSFHQAAAGEEESHGFSVSDTAVVMAATAVGSDTSITSAAAAKSKSYRRRLNESAAGANTNQNANLDDVVSDGSYMGDDSMLSSTSGASLSNFLAASEPGDQQRPNESSKGLSSSDGSEDGIPSDDDDDTASISASSGDAEPTPPPRNIRRDVRPSSGSQSSDGGGGVSLPSMPASIRLGRASDDSYHSLTAEERRARRREYRQDRRDYVDAEMDNESLADSLLDGPERDRLEFIDNPDYDDLFKKALPLDMVVELVDYVSNEMKEYKERVFRILYSLNYSYRSCDDIFIKLH